MKNALTLLMAAAIAGTAMGAPLKVALLDFEDVTGGKPDARLGGSISTSVLAPKGVYAMSKALLKRPAFTLVDRRDFISQIEKLRLADDGKPTPHRPSFVHAAQTLGADAVLRGKLQSLSTGKRVVNQGGHQAEFARLSVRVSIEALDVTDGSVIAISDGVSSRDFRQTAEVYSELGEEDILQLYDAAIAEAVPRIEEALSKRMAAVAARARVKLSVLSDADPALVEIDGVLVGSTPLENLEVYKGDHVLTVGKAGHRDITKRINLEQDTRVTVPLMRVELSAEEMKEVLKNVRFHAFHGVEPALVIETIRE